MDLAQTLVNEMLGTSEKQAATIDCLKSGAAIRKMKGRYLDIEIKTTIVVTVTATLDFITSAVWEHSVKSTGVTLPRRPSPA